jgi:hypothetical protein
MSYSIYLTNRELIDLSWASARGYFPSETYDAMYLADGESEDDDSPYIHRKWLIPEFAARHILLERLGDPHSLYSCIGEPLLGKLIDLENSIT